MYMQKDYFSLLSVPAQIGYLINYGEIINEIEAADHYTSLFMLHGFFTEARLDKDSSEIDSIRVVDDLDHLYKYVSGLDLPA